MKAVAETIQRVADTGVDVLILGETGTGKELVARSVHHLGRCPDGPFVPIDCGAIPENLLESELFGYEQGAFTGADRQRRGLLETASGGTFFLDEIGDLPLLLQAKLLRVLQERKLRRVGGNTEVDIDVRIVAATSKWNGEFQRSRQPPTRSCAATTGPATFANSRTLFAEQSPFLMMTKSARTTYQCHLSRQPRRRTAVRGAVSSRFVTSICRASNANISKACCGDTEATSKNLQGRNPVSAAEKPLR